MVPIFVIWSIFFCPARSLNRAPTLMFAIIKIPLLLSPLATVTTAVNPNVLDYQLVFGTNKTYTDDLQDPMSKEFRELSKLLEEKLEDLLKKNGLGNYTVGIVLQKVRDQNGQAEVHIDIRLNGTSVLTLKKLNDSINAGLEKGKTLLGNLTVFSPIVRDKYECSQQGVCPADQSCINFEGSYQCYCEDPNHAVIGASGKCEEVLVFEGKIIIKNLEYTRALADPNSAIFKAISDEIQKIIQATMKGQPAADNIIDIRVFAFERYSKDNVTVKYLFYVKKSSNLTSSQLQQILRYDTSNTTRKMLGKYLIFMPTVCDYDECAASGGNNLPKVSCGFGECINVIGTYRCHCDGNVHTANGKCVPRTTQNISTDDRWWVKYAIALGALFVLIILLIIVFCCMEIIGSPQRERYSDRGMACQDGKQAYHLDVRNDNEVDLANPRRSNEYVMEPTVSDVYEINPIDNEESGNEDTYRSSATAKCDTNC